MTSKVKRVIEVARARAAHDSRTCFVCRGRLARHEPSIHVHAGTAHARCAAYTPRRRASRG